jgi:hypothetical protein
MQANSLNKCKKKLFFNEISFGSLVFSFYLCNRKELVMFDLYKTYNKAKDVFVKPKLKISFGLWKNMGGLPVWRRGHYISIAKSHQYYRPESWSYYREERAGTVRKDDTIVKYDKLGVSKHQLPKGCNGYVWRSPIRKKLRKWKLGWLKPVYELPLWLSFYCFDWDVIYKWKYDDIRFEYPPQFTLVFFGLALSFTLVAPIEGDDYADWYWDSLLSYLYQDECEQSIEKTLYFCGQWTHHQNGEEYKSFQLKKHYIKPEYYEEYDRAVLNYNNKKNEEE